MKLVVEFEWLGIDHSTPAHIGSSGYIYLSLHPKSAALWLSLIPSICLSIFGALVAIYIFKYGTYVALDNNSKWKFASFSILGQIVGQLFDYEYYSVSSNAGEMLLLVGLTYLVYLAQYELSQAASYADFLHRSNGAFFAIKQAISDTKNHIDIEIGLNVKQTNNNNAWGGTTGNGHDNGNGNNLDSKLPYQNRISGRFVADYVRKHKASMDRKPPSAELLATITASRDGEDDIDSDAETDEGENLERVSDAKVHGGNVTLALNRERDTVVLHSNLESSNSGSGSTSPTGRSSVGGRSVTGDVSAGHIVLDLSEF